MLLHLRGQLQPGHSRHLDIRDNDVRPQAQHLAPGTRPIPARSHDLDVLFEIQQGRECPPHHALILGQQDGDHVRTALGVGDDTGLEVGRAIEVELTLGVAPGVEPGLEPPDVDAPDAATEAGAASGTRTFSTVLAWVR